jgi:hypothetical protein
VKRIIASLLAAGAIAGIAVSGPAVARPAKVDSTCGTCVAPITCTVEDQCVLDFVGNNGAGYWRARQWNGSTWVRLTLVNGG